MGGPAPDNSSVIPPAPAAPVHVNLQLRQDVTGVILRQKATLDAVAATLCDRYYDPAEQWRKWGRTAMRAGLHDVAAALSDVADLIEKERL